MEKKTILNIKNLNKDFDIGSRSLLKRNEKLHALSNINLEIYEGETLGIIGESGCGKTTLGRCIIGLYSPTSGLIEYHGEKLDYKANKSLRRQIQMIFQDPYSALNPRKTCGQLVEEPMIIHKLYKNKQARKTRVASHLKEVGLDAQYIHRYPHEFSGGQRQRINIARALSLNPRLLICDEPVSALDVSIQAQVLNLFRDLQKEHQLTYMFISHDLGIIRHISDRIAIMYLGRLVELCSADEIYSAPLHPYTQALLSAIPPASPHEKKVPIPLNGEIPSPIGKQVGCPFAPRCIKSFERCREDTPVLKEHQPGHQVACFLYENTENIDNTAQQAFPDDALKSLFNQKGRISA